MRTLIFLTIIAFGNLIIRAADQIVTDAFFGPRVIVRPEMQDTVDSWFKGKATNGLVCAVNFDRPYGNKKSPLFNVAVINATTNFIHAFLKVPLEASANIELLDPKGKPVAKTEAGKQINPWSDQQITDWFNDLLEKRSHFQAKSGSITGTFFPLLDFQVRGEVSLPHLFQLKQAGEYTLHLKMKVAFTRLNTAGKIEMNIFWLPEVVAKVQIRPEDIPLENRPATSQTNSPAK